MGGLLAAAMLAGVGTLFSGIVVSDEMVRTLNNFFTLLTVGLLVWNQRRMRKEVEPKVEEVRERTEQLSSQLTHWDGTTERRKAETE